MSKYANIPPGINPRDEMPDTVMRTYIITDAYMHELGKDFSRRKRKARKNKRRYQHQKRKQ